MSNNTELSAKTQYVSSLFDALHELTGDQEYWQEKDGHFVPVQKLFYLQQDQCPHKVATVSALNSKLKQDRSKVLQKSYDALAPLRKDLKDPNIEERKIRYWLRFFKKQIQIMSISIDGKVRHFESFAKGTPRYEKKMAFKAMDFIKNHCDGEWETVFYTATCWDKLFNLNPAKAWEEYDDKVLKPTLDNLRKHFGCEYVRVLEATKQGYPHAHCVLAFPKGTIKDWETKKNKEPVEGKVFEWVKEHSFQPQFDLQIAKGDNTKWYLTKYLTKATQENIFSLADKNGRLSDAQRKAAVAFLASKAFRLRTLVTCKDRSKAGLAKEQEKKAARVLQEQKQKELVAEIKSSTAKPESKSERQLANLTRLCNNSPLTCASSFKFMSYTRYEKLFGGFPKRNEEINPEKQAIFNQHCGGFGCGGCFITAITDFIKCPEHSILNRKFTFSVRKNIYSYLTDGYNLDVPEEKLQCIKDTVNFYMKKIYLEGAHLEDIIRCKEDVAMKVQNVKWKKEMKRHDEKEEMELEEIMMTYRTMKQRQSILH